MTPSWMKDPFTGEELSIATFPNTDACMVVCQEKNGRRGWTSDIFPSKSQALDWLKWRDGRKIADAVTVNRRKNIDIPAEEPPSKPELPA